MSAHFKFPQLGDMSNYHNRITKHETAHDTNNLLPGCSFLFMTKIHISFDKNFGGVKVHKILVVDMIIVFSMLSSKNISITIHP